MTAADLYCGGGGAGAGLRRAGFAVVGFDKHHRKLGYAGGRVVKMDVLKMTPAHLGGFDFVWASPPCQANTRAKHLRDAQGKTTTKVDLIPQTRALLKQWGGPWVIENVPGAPLREDLMLCGSMFGLKVRRHRIFESNLYLGLQPQCQHAQQGRPVGIYGSKADDIPAGGSTARTLQEGLDAMGIDWPMSWSALVEAIPPAFSEFIGARVLAQLVAAGGVS